MRRQSSARDRPPILHLHTCVPESEKRPDLVGQSFEVIRLEVVSPARTDGYDRLCHGDAQFFSKVTIEGLLRDLPCSVPERHVQGANGDTPPTVPSWFLLPHHAVPGAQGVDILPRLGGDLVLASRHESRHETITQQTGLGKAPEGRKAEAHDLLAVALHIRLSE